MSKVTIFEQESANGNYPSAGVAVPFKQGLLAVLGTFGTASVKLQMSHDGGSNWEDVRDQNGNVVTWTTDQVDTHIPYIPSTYLLRGVISGATGGESLSMYLSN